MSNPIGNRKRHSFTKECVFLALKKIIVDKPIKSITISQLISCAGISRSTFYRNYHTIYDVIEDYLSTYPFGADSEESYTLEQFNLKDRLFDSFTALKNNQLFVNRLLEANLESLIYQNYDFLIKGLCKDRAYELGFCSEYELSAFVGLYYSICYNWIKAGMSEPIPVMIDISYDIISHFHP